MLLSIQDCSLYGAHFLIGCMLHCRIPEPLLKLLVQIHETTKENHKLLKSLFHAFKGRPFDFVSHVEAPYSCPQLPGLDGEGLEKLQLCFSDQDDRFSSPYLLFLVSITLSTPLPSPLSRS